MTAANGRRLLVILLLGFFPFVCIEAQQRDGCITHVALTKDLSTLASLDWKNVDEKKLRSVWPVPIKGADCANGTCGTLEYQGRVIDNECECCELFTLGTLSDGSGKVIQGTLNGIMVYYSVSKQADLIEQVKGLAMALGLSPSDAQAIRFKGPALQDFNWTVHESTDSEISLLSIKVFERHGLWTAYLAMTRHPL